MRRSLLLLTIILFSLVSLVHGAGVIGLPKTGQTKCYDDTAVSCEIPCSGTGQDGEIQAGHDWPDPRFTPGTGAGTDCITDNLTGLMWARNGSLPDGKEKVWNYSIDYAYSLSLCGHSDWRLPNINELESLVNRGELFFMSWLMTQGFTNVRASTFWSSTTNPSDHSRGFGVFQRGNIVDSDKGYYLGLWSVRSAGGSPGPSAIPKTGQIISYRTGDDGDLQAGTDWPSPRFTDGGKGTVTDNLTGLIWTKDANAPGPASCKPGLAMKWKAALDFVKCLNAAKYLGFFDWRLPNIKELSSLRDYSHDNPVIPKGHPFINVRVKPADGDYPHYWTSTTELYDNHLAWTMNMVNGGPTGHGKTIAGCVWPVRGGAPGRVPLVVSKSGIGGGMVTSEPAGIDCGTACSAAFAYGSTITLTAAAQGGSTFTGWSGGNCSGTGPCTVVMTEGIRVTAEFYAPCVYTISPKSKSFTPQAGSVSVSVAGTGKSSCPEPIITKNDDWVTAALVQTWKKNKGAVTVSVKANQGYEPRTASLTIGAKPFAVSQAGIPCLNTTSYSESYRQNVVCTNDDGVIFCEVKDAGSFAVSAKISLAGVNIKDFNKDTEFGFDMGSFSFNTTLGADPLFAPGKKSARFIYRGTSKSGKAVTYLTVTLGWNTAQLSVAVSGVTPEFLPTILAGDFVGAETGKIQTSVPVNLSLAGGPVLSAAGEAAVRGQVTTGTVVRNEEEFLISNISLAGQGTLCK